MYSNLTEDQVREVTDALLEDTAVMEYVWPKLSSAKFSYHKHPEIKKKGWQDNGICEVCGKRGAYTLIQPDKPRLCYKCYTAVRAYRNLRFDVLRLQKKKNLTLKEVQKIVTYMKNYTRKKANLFKMVTTALVVASLSKSKKH